MKKIIVPVLAALLLSSGVAGFNNSSKVVKAEIAASDLQNLLTSYNDGGYTKKTTMYLTETAQAETQYFHAGANTLQRATYYNASETALLMGNYDGTFGGVDGASGINSGYRNNGSDSVEHFRYVDTEASAANLFSDNYTTGDWTAANQTVGGYYQTLTSLANIINNDDWVYSEGAFIHNINNLSLIADEYSDNILKQFQYFAAPMMLQNNYFSWTTIRVTNANSFLSIRLYADVVDSAKSTMVGEAEVLVSEARIYKGISLSPEASWHLKGSFDSWGDGEELEYSADLYNPEQYRITHTFAAGDQFLITDGTSYYKYSDVENQAWFSSSTPDGNIVAKLSCAHTIYFKPIAGTMYIAIPDDTTAEYVITLNNTWNIKDASAIFRLYVWGGSYGSGEWLETTLTGSSGSWVFTTTLSISATGAIVVRLNPSGGINWDAKWNQTADINLSDGVLTYSSSF